MRKNRIDYIIPLHLKEMSAMRCKSNTMYPYKVFLSHSYYAIQLLPNFIKDIIYNMCVKCLSALLDD